MLLLWPVITPGLHIHLTYSPRAPPTASEKYQVSWREGLCSDGLESSETKKNHIIAQINKKVQHYHKGEVYGIMKTNNRFHLFGEVEGELPWGSERLGWELRKK